MRNSNSLLTVFFKKHHLRLWNIVRAWERRGTRIISTSIISFLFFIHFFFTLIVLILSTLRIIWSALNIFQLLWHLFLPFVYFVKKCPFFPMRPRVPPFTNGSREILLLLNFLPLWRFNTKHLNENVMFMRVRYKV